MRTLASVLILGTLGTALARAQQWVPLPAPPATSVMFTFACEFRNGVLAVFERYQAPREAWFWNGSRWVAAASPPFAVGQLVFDPARSLLVSWDGIRLMEYDGTSWQASTPTSGPTVNGHSLGYDPTTQRIVLWGGNISGSALNDMWAWNGAGWVQVAASQPPPSHPHSLCADRIRNRLVLVVGSAMWVWNGVVWAPVVGPQVPLGQHLQFVQAPNWPDFTLRVWFGAVFIHQYYSASWSALSPLGFADEVLTVDGGTGDLFAVRPGMAWRYTLNVPGSTTPYGAGCGAPPATLRAAAPPQIGVNLDLTLTYPAASTLAAGLGAGLSRTTFQNQLLPLQLDWAGMPGCFLLQDLALGATSMTPGPGVATLSIAVPNQLALVGLITFFQGWAVVPGTNSTGLVTSDGLEVRIGR